MYDTSTRAFLADVGVPLEQVTDALVRQWASDLRGSEATRARHVATVASLLAFAFEQGILENDLSASLPRVRSRRDPRSPLDAAVLQAVVQAAKEGRDRALARLVLEARVPIAVVARLTREDVTDDGVCKDGRRYPLADDLRSELLVAEGVLFRSVTGRPLATRNMRAIITEAAARAGVTASLTDLKQAPTRAKRPYVERLSTAGPYGIIYGLYHPSTGALHYVGMTRHKLDARLRGHLSAQNLTKRTRAAGWLRSLAAEGLTPRAEVLAEASSRDELLALERLHIRAARASGAPLVNSVHVRWERS